LLTNEEKTAYVHSYQHQKKLCPSHKKFKRIPFFSQNYRLHQPLEGRNSY
jgi:hypothetical protein